MTYAKGSNITAADYNAFAGLTGTAAANSAAAQNKAGYLYDVGYGDRGYGQGPVSVTTLSTKVAGSPVGQEWKDLRTVVSTLATWTKTPTTLLPPAASLNAGTSIVAHEQDSPSLNAYDFQTLLATIDSARFDYEPNSMVLVNQAATTSRASAWGGGAGGITAEFSVTFTNEDKARYFFNSGGEVRISLSHPSTLTSRDASWNTVLNNLVVAFRANSSARLTGTSGTAQAIGYYQLTTSYQTILDGTNSGSGVYSTNDFTVAARAVSITGLNGAKGSVLYFRVQLVDQQTNAFSDIVQAGTVTSLSHIRAGGVLSVTAPVCALVTAF
jgi:hypothetical protein